MKCFYHQDTDAVGICKSCSKGICKDCAVVVGNGIACKGRCEGEVEAINTIFQWSKTSHHKTGSVYSRSAIIWALLGVIFTVYGIYMIDTSLGYFLIPGGIILCLGAISQFYASQKFRQP